LKYGEFTGVFMVKKMQASIIFSVLAFWKKHSKNTLTEKTHLLFGKEAIPWEMIDRIHVKKSEMGNQYMSVYFNDQSTPCSFNLEKIPDREDLIHYVEVYAHIKGYDFTRDTA
jgi:hypothetical protein